MADVNLNFGQVYVVIYCYIRSHNPMFSLLSEFRDRDMFLCWDYDFDVEIFRKCCIQLFLCGGGGGGEGFHGTICFSPD